MRSCFVLRALRGPHFCTDRNGGKSGKRGKGFRFPFPLLKPLSLKRPKGASRPLLDFPLGSRTASVCGGRADSRYQTEAQQSGFGLERTNSGMNEHPLADANDMELVRTQSPLGASFIQYFLCVQKVLAPERVIFWTAALPSPESPARYSRRSPRTSRSGPHSVRRRRRCTCCGHSPG